MTRRRGRDRARAALLLAALALGAGAACSPRVPRARLHVVEIRGLRFEPARLVVAPGDTVEWRNHDVVPHTTTARDHAWGSGAIRSDSSWRTVISTAGRHVYDCALHSNMHGEIDVAGSRMPRGAAAAGKRAVAAVLSGTAQLRMGTGGTEIAMARSSRRGLGGASLAARLVTRASRSRAAARTTA